MIVRFGHCDVAYHLRKRRSMLRELRQADPGASGLHVVQVLSYTDRKILEARLHRVALNVEPFITIDGVIDEGIRIGSHCDDAIAIASVQSLGHVADRSYHFQHVNARVRGGKPPSVCGRSGDAHWTHLASLLNVRDSCDAAGHRRFVRLRQLRSELGRVSRYEDEAE
eukprot:6612763-Prymnesium_polylepis.1